MNALPHVADHLSPAQIAEIRRYYGVTVGLYDWRAVIAGAHLRQAGLPLLQIDRVLGLFK